MLDERRDHVCPKCGGPKWSTAGPGTLLVEPPPPDCEVCGGAGMVTEANARAYHIKSFKEWQKEYEAENKRRYPSSLNMRKPRR